MVNTIKLIEPCLELEGQYMNMVADFAAAGDTKDWDFEEAKKGFAAFVQKRHEWKYGRNLPDGWVPGSTFWLVGDNNVILGVSSLRYKLTDNLRRLGGHIGYKIRPGQRQKGYGTMILKMTLAEAEKLGMTKVLVTCDDDNIASAKIIEKNGGVLKDKCDRDEHGKLTRRYWIDLKNLTLT
jgi:predicted acetyltransferase